MCVVCVWMCACVLTKAQPQPHPQQTQEGNEAPGSIGGGGRLSLVHTRTLKLADDVLALRYSRTKDPDKCVLRGWVVLYVCM